VCELFSADDAILMEWLDDVRLYEIQGYGATVNYAIAGGMVPEGGGGLPSSVLVEWLDELRLHRSHGYGATSDQASAGGSARRG
jgi:hypothetical protein